MQLVLFCGKAENGKTTAARIMKEILEEEFDKKVLIMGFADQLKFIATKYFGWDGKKDEAGRKLLQHLGTDIVRNRHPDYWVEQVYNFIKVFGRDFDYILCDDTRFRNEINYFPTQQIYPFTIRIHRLHFENSLTAEQRLHPSETSLDNFPVDLEIYSESGHFNLRRDLELIFEAGGLSPFPQRQEETL